MALLRFLFNISPRMMTLAVIIGVVAGVSSAGLIVVINTQLSSPQTAWNLPAAFLALGTLMLISNTVSRVLLAKLSQRAAYEIRMRLSRLVMDAGLRRIEQVGPARLQVALTDDVLVIANALAALPPMCVGAAILGVCLLYLGWLLAAALLALAILIAVGVAVYQFAARRALDWLRRAREKQNRLFEHLRSLIQGTKELRLHRGRREAFFDSVLGRAGAEVRDDTVRGIAWFAAAESWGQFLFFFCIGLLLFEVPRILAVDRALLMAYTLTLLYMMTPIQAILTLLPVLGRAEVSLRQIEKLGFELRAAAELPSENEMPAAAPPYSLQLEDISLAYEGEHGDRPFLLGPISVSFQPGEVVFLTGGNGSGKTTLAKIIVGLYPPASGAIRLNGIEITTGLEDFYRQCFSAVFSDFFLFDGFPGLERHASPERVAAYLERLELGRKVRLEDGRFSTLDLSQGHRKRLALLVAYLEDRPFLVFDEWAADQDPEFKQIFYYELIPELKARNKTVIVISHDDRYFGVADRIVRLESGRVVTEEGALSANQEKTVSA